MQSRREGSYRRIPKDPGITGVFCDSILLFRTAHFRRLPVLKTPGRHLLYFAEGSRYVRCPVSGSVPFLLHLIQSQKYPDFLSYALDLRILPAERFPAGSATEEPPEQPFCYDDPRFHKAPDSETGCSARQITATMPASGSSGYLNKPARLLSGKTDYIPED